MRCWKGSQTAVGYGANAREGTRVVEWIALLERRERSNTLIANQMEERFTVFSNAWVALSQMSIPGSHAKAEACEEDHNLTAKRG